MSLLIGSMKTLREGSMRCNSTTILQTATTDGSSFRHNWGFGSSTQITMNKTDTCRKGRKGNTPFSSHFLYSLKKSKIANSYTSICIVYKRSLKRSKQRCNLLTIIFVS